MILSLPLQFEFWSLRQDFKEAKAILSVFKTHFTLIETINHRKWIILSLCIKHNEKLHEITRGEEPISGHLKIHIAHKQAMSRLMRVIWHAYLSHYMPGPDHRILPITNEWPDIFHSYHKVSPYRRQRVQHHTFSVIK